ncbi:MAG TPA: hypothetical protein VFO60_00260 [Candidatus Dormibacteraeota bacterium]|nr:hypothetical protein [Candidatus Dormibacteraeota bacterium]
MVPDVAALAGPPLYDLIFLGQPMPNGGTSASAPLWASVLARIAAMHPGGARLPWITPLLYRPGKGGGSQPLGATGCTDVTQGDNHSPVPGTGYAAGAGYDAVSGWGTPNGTRLGSGI